MEPEKKVITEKELSEALGISINFAYKEVRNGNIFSVKCGDRYLIPVKSLYRMLSVE